MKLHFISRSYAVPLAFQAQLAGCDVRVHLPDTSCGNGLFPRAPDPHPTGKPDAVILDGLGWGSIAKELESKGHRVLFGGQFAELMAARGDYHARVMEKAGFSLADPAAEDSAPYLLIVGGWYENGLCPPYYCGVLRHRLLAHDAGPVAGPMGAEIAPLPNSDQIDRLLLPVAEAISGVAYRGLLSVVLLPTPEPTPAMILTGIHPQLIEALSEMIRGGFPALIQGNVQPSGDCGVSVQISVPPWPYQASKEKFRFALDSGQARHFWPLDVSQVGSEYQYCGAVGMLGSVTARGRPMPEMPDDITPEDGWAIRRKNWFMQAGGRASWTVRGMRIPNGQYRDDIGKHAERALECLLQNKRPELSAISPGEPPSQSGTSE